MKQMFTENWESKLETQFFKNDRCRKRAYICSPLRGRNEEETLDNMKNAQAFMYCAMTELGYYARAPHAYLPMLLHDAVPAERALALQFGRRLLESSDILLVCGNQLSLGMQDEIRHAIPLAMPIYTFDKEMYHAVQKHVTLYGGKKQLVHLDLAHPFLGWESPIIHAQNVGCFS